MVQVKGRVDEFKEHLPLLSALFNPGLRDRHWEKMTEIAGQDLRPNDVNIYLPLTINICEFCHSTLELQPVTICGDEFGVVS